MLSATRRVTLNGVRTRVPSLTAAAAAGPPTTAVAWPTCVPRCSQLRHASSSSSSSPPPPPPDESPSTATTAATTSDGAAGTTEEAVTAAAAAAASAAPTATATEDAHASDAVEPKRKSKYAIGDIDPELNAPRRATAAFSVRDLEDAASGTVGFGRIDDIESEVLLNDRGEGQASRHNAVLALSSEEKWKHHMMFVHKVVKTPKHLTWTEFGNEVECCDCIIELDDHRPEEKFTLKFQFRDRRHGTRDDIWSATHDVATSAALGDLLAAIGTCLSRADVHRVIRFDDGLGSHREMVIQKNSAFTSEVRLSFRPTVRYDLYSTAEAHVSWEDSLTQTSGGGWGFHPDLANDPDYRDNDDPVGTYHMTISAHALSIVILKAIDRLIQRPLHEFYRPSQVAKSVRRKESEDLGVAHAIQGWLGTDERKFPHFTPIEALESHWFGEDSPFSLVAIVNKLREMSKLKPENPEFKSWLAVRKNDSATAARNVRTKMLGAGASSLFTPLGHSATMNQLLPKDERRVIKATVSAAGMIGMPDETRRLAELKRIAESGKMLSPGEEVEVEVPSSSKTTKVEGEEEPLTTKRGGEGAPPQGGSQPPPGGTA